MYAFFHTTHAQPASLHQEAATPASLEMAIAVERARRANAAKANPSPQARDTDLSAAKHPWAPLGSYLPDQADRFQVH